MAFPSSLSTLTLWIYFNHTMTVFLLIGGLCHLKNVLSCYCFFLRQLQQWSMLFVLYSNHVCPWTFLPFCVLCILGTRVSTFLFLLSPFLACRWSLPCLEHLCFSWTALRYPLPHTCDTAAVTFVLFSVPFQHSPTLPQGCLNCLCRLIQ